MWTNLTDSTKIRYEYLEREMSFFKCKIENNENKFLTISHPPEEKTN